MKIKFKLLFISMIALIFLSCDKDDFEYSDVEVFTVSGVQKNYSKINLVDKLTINPSISSNKEGNLEYMWGLYPANLQLGIATLDTISTTKELDYLVNKDADNYKLVLTVSNTNTGFTDFFTYDLSVGTEFTQGWYVLKDENNESDMDLFLTPNSIAPKDRLENVYSAVNDKKLEGKGMQLRFNTLYKSEVSDGYFDNTRSLFLIAENDASVVNISSLKEIRDPSTLIYGGVENKNFGMFGFDFLATHIINDGQLHSMVAQGYSYGQFGGRKMKNVNDDPYFLSKYHLLHLFPFFFDEISSSFVTARDRSVYLDRVNDLMPFPIMPISANNNNKTLLYMGMISKDPFSGVAVFQDKTNISEKGVSIVEPIGTNLMKLSYTPLQADKELYNADHYGMIYEDEKMLYFSSSKEVWSYNINNNFEQKQFTVPANETITFVQHRKNQISGANFPEGYVYNYICVGSVDDVNNYKVRMFTKQSGNLSKEPVHVLEGKGTPRDIIFIAPQLVSNSAFPDTY